MGAAMQIIDVHPSLGLRRAALLARIHNARLETAEAGRLVVMDLQATERTRRSILGGLKIAKAALLAAGLIWSLKSPSPIGRGSRLLTVAVSMLSTLRTLRRLSVLLIPLASPTPLTGRSHHENRSH